MTTAGRTGGHLVAEVLQRQGVTHLFTLIGGHISPILVESKRAGIRVVDTRDEVTAAFAADAMARLTGVGVAAVTAGPGVTNTLTALTNALMARSPMVLLGGATATVLKGRGSLQDIDQLAAVRPHVKRALRVARMQDLVPTLERAFAEARGGIPGPVFVELPVDLLYDASLVRESYGLARPLPAGAPLGARAERWYLERHLRRLLHPSSPAPSAPVLPTRELTAASTLSQLVTRVKAATRPVLIVGSQAIGAPDTVDQLAASVTALGIPTYLAGMARGLLGASHPLQLRHKRKEALREADLVVLAGVPMDFRLDYGRSIGRGAVLVTLNRDSSELHRNRRASLGVAGDPDLVLRDLAARAGGGGAAWGEWLAVLKARDAARDAEVTAQGEALAPPVNPVALCQAIERALDDDSVLVADGGDFVATASYIVRPRRPLSWLDPGAFGTLGVGAGFAMAAKLQRPASEVWLLWGDGAAGYGLVELDRFRMHGLPVIVVVGNDGSWAQIARDQVPMLGDDVGTVLGRTDFHVAAEGLGARGLLLDDPARMDEVLAEAKAIARAGTPVLVNAHIGTTEFRKGSLSM